MPDKIQLQYVPVSEPIFIELPASKSLSNRALIIQHLCDSHFAILNLSEADDTINLLNNLSSGNKKMNVGAAGTNMRFLISCLSISPGEWLLEGTERLNQRPVGDLVNCLRKLGAQIHYQDKEGCPPLSITGKNLDGGEVGISGEVSSQFISSLLLIAPCLKMGLKLHIESDLVSKPYVEMTLAIMNHFEVQHEWKNNTINIQSQKYVAKDYVVEPDWSSAAFWYAFVALTQREVMIKGLSLNSLQGDKKLAEYGELIGVKTIESKEGIRLTRNGNISSSIQLNLINEPDLFPILAFTCAALKLKAIFTGLQTLPFKESDRIRAVSTELGKLNIQCNSTDSSFEILSYGILPATFSFNTYDDHRMAMAASVFALIHPHVTISNHTVVSKSYPGFWDDLALVGCRVQRD